MSELEELKMIEEDVVETEGSLGMDTSDETTNNAREEKARS